MRFISASRIVAVISSALFLPAVTELALAASSAVAREFRIGPLQTPISPNLPPAQLGSGALQNSTNTVYTGLVDGSNSLFTLEPVPPLRSDVVTFNGVQQQINDYATIATTPLQGQRRFVTETSLVDSGGVYTTDIFDIRCVDAAGAPADLWPQGITVGGVSLPNGGAGVGIPLNAALGGAAPVALQPGTEIDFFNVEVVSNGVSSGPIDLSPAAFFQPSPSNWNGQLGLVFFGAATGADIDSEIIFRITSRSIPEPASIVLLGAGIGIGLIRRHRVTRAPIQ